jgi:TolA-binding protein
MDPRRKVNFPLGSFLLGCSSMRRVVLMSVVALFSGCAAGGGSIKSLERSVADLRAMQSEQTDALSSLDSQLRALSGRVEEIEFAQNKRLGLGSEVSALKEDLSNLKRLVPPPAAVPVPELEADEEWASNLPAEQAQLFVDSLALIREGKFTDALPGLKEVSERLGSSPKTAQPLFWQAVAHEGLAHNGEARGLYFEVSQRYSKSNRAPTSLYRLALLLARTGDKKTATLSLRSLVEKYPKSPEAPMAKDKIKELK